MEFSDRTPIFRAMSTRTKSFENQQIRPQRRAAFPRVKEYGLDESTRSDLSTSRKTAPVPGAFRE
jgi:hypothetical protein